jgi:hypothetical protein
MKDDVYSSSDEKEKKRPSRVPDDFESEAEFMDHVRKTYSMDAGADRDNRDEELEDHKFTAGEQWDPDVYNRRVNNKKPALTINRLPAFAAQVIGNRRLNETTINVIPDSDKYKANASVRREIIRNIQKQSTAKRAYDVAYQNQVIGGLGNFEIDIDYENDFVFDQEIKIEAIHNPLAVVWPRLCFDPTGRDAPYVFVTDRVDREEFKKKWPDAIEANFEGSESEQYQTLSVDGWIDENTVRIATFWRMRTRKRRLALMIDGEVNDITEEDFETVKERVAQRDDGTYVTRVANCKYAQKYLVSGASILEGPYDLKIDRVPVFRCPGWEINIGDKRIRFGLIRFLRDPQRLHNYWRSVIAEKLMMSPKAQWLAALSTVKGREKAFRQSHLSEDPLLVWNDEASDKKPERVPPVQLEPALIQEAGMAAQDIKDISNLHEANLGQTSNEVSGKAIMARQRVGETGTVIYQDNLNMAIEEAGKVINQLIPYVYDTPRVLKIAGDTEDELKFIRVNFDDDDSVDLSEGRFNITSSTGPSYETKRIESRESMMAAVNAMPDVFAAVADLIAEAQDWPGADKIARRIRATMPPNILGTDMTPEQQQQVQAQAQDAELDKELEREEKKAKIEETRARAMKARADAAKSEAQAIETEASIDRDDATADANIASQERRDALQTIDALRGENNV